MSGSELPPLRQDDSRPGPERLSYSKSEAAATLGVSVDFFDEHVQPEIRIVRCGRRRLVPRAELQRWLERSATRALEDRR
jgi:excisionase family DNA binding protein